MTFLSFRGSYWHEVQFFISMVGGTAAKDASMEGCEPYVTFVISYDGTDFIMSVLVVTFVKLLP